MRSTGDHHVDLVVSSLERNLPFYRGLLGPLGWTRSSEVEGERGETTSYDPDGLKLEIVHIPAND